MRKKIITGILIALLVPCAVVIAAMHMKKEPAGPAAAEAVWEPSESRQVMLCMGEKKDTMFISWRGDKDGPRLLRFSEDKYSLPVTVPVMAEKTKILTGNHYRYKVRLTDLKAGKTYHYEIGDGVAYDVPRSFSVPDEDSEDVFVYLGDPQFDKSVADYEAWGDLTRKMYEEHPEVEFAIIGGDMVNLPARKDHWNGFLDNCDVFSELPVQTIPGNHEGVTSNNTYKKIFHHLGNGPYGEAFYWFETEQCRFIMVDSSFLTKARQMTMGKALWNAQEQEIKAWLKDSLSESSKRWNIVVTHHPVYGMHDVFTVSKDIREKWLPTIKGGGADLVLCGHQHVYMRTRPIDGSVYVMGVSGPKRSNYYTGSNAPVYAEAVYASGPNYQIIRADEDSIEIVSYNEKGSIIDAARIGNSFKLPYSQIF